MKYPEALDDICLSCHGWLDRFAEIFARKNLRFLGYEVSSISRRLRQAIWAEVWQEYQRNYDPGTDSSHTRIDVRKDRIGIDWKSVRKGLQAFAKTWLVCLLGIARSLVSVRNRGGARAFAVLQCFGSESAVKNADRFAAFCRRGPVEPLHNTNVEILVACRLPEDLTPGKPFQISWQPFQAILRLRPPSSMIGLRLFFQQLGMLPRFLLQVIRHPETSLLHQDFALHPIILHLNNRGLLSWVFYDNSTILNQILPIAYLPERRFSTGILFYSVNNKPHIFQEGGTGVAWPTYRYLTADVSWVWNADQEAWLRENTGIREYKIVGPILYSLPHPEPLARPTNGTLNILVFDVTPSADDHLQQVFGRYVELYINTLNCTNFIRDILEACKRLGRGKYSIAVKQKNRPHKNKGWSVDYLNFLEKQFESGELQLADFDADLCDLISAHDLVISFPFTSPNYVAQKLGIPSVYYDPAGRLRCNFPLLENMGFIQDPKQLSEVIRKMQHRKEQDSG